MTTKINNSVLTYAFNTESQPYNKVHTNLTIMCKSFLKDSWLAEWLLMLSNAVPRKNYNLNKNWSIPILNQLWSFLNKTKNKTIWNQNHSFCHSYKKIKQNQTKLQKIIPHIPTKIVKLLLPEISHNCLVARQGMMSFWAPMAYISWSITRWSFSRERVSDGRMWNVPGDAPCNSLWLSISCNTTIQH